MRRLFLFSLVLFFGFQAHADEPTLKIIAVYIPYFIESENSGAFVTLAETIGKKLKVKVEFQISPSLRAIDLFKKHQGQAFLPGSHPKFIGIEYYETETIFIKKVYIFTKSTKEITRIDQLANKRVGTTLGYTYPDLQEIPGIDIQTAPHDEANLLKLKLNRIDAFLGEEQSVSKALEKLGYKDIHRSPNALTSEPIFFAFQKTEQGKIWRQKFNDVIKVMKKNGELDKILQGK